MRLIAAIDASAAARPVLRVATELASRMHLDLEVVHVDQGDPGPAVAIARSCGLEATIRHGEPGKALAEELLEDDVVLGVIGLRGWPGGRQPAGRTAIDLVEQTHCPIVLVPPHAFPSEADDRIALVPIDGSEATDRSVRKVLKLFRGSGIVGRALHVFDPTHVPRFTDQPQHELPAWINEFLARHADAGLRLELRAGSADAAVLSCAQDIGADLIALAWSQDASPGHAHVVLEVLGHTPVPVLLVPVGAAPARAASP